MITTLRRENPKKNKDARRKRTVGYHQNVVRVARGIKRARVCQKCAQVFVQKLQELRVKAGEDKTKRKEMQKEAERLQKKVGLATKGKWCETHAQTS